HPEKEWKRKLSEEGLIEEMRSELQTYPGIVFGFSQPIQDNVEEYVAGVKSSLVVKIFGNDLFQLEEYADQVAEASKDVEGIEDVNVYRNIGLPELRIQIGGVRSELHTYPGIVFGFSQPIQDNVEEYVAGVKSSLVVKIFGNDLFQLEEYADQVAEAIKDVEGIEDLNVYRNIGLPELRIQLHDHKMARYGVDMANAQAVVEMAIGGSAATTFYEEDRMFDVRIRFAKEYRDDEEKIGDILIPTGFGKKIPLREIATISYITGPTFIYRDGSSRYIAVGFSIEGRDLGS